VLPHPESVALICPALHLNGSSGGIGPGRELRRPGAAHSHPLSTIGLELRVAFAVMGTNGGSTADSSFWLRKCRELLLRPAVEPVLFAHWNKLKSFEMTEPEVASISSMLLGSKQKPRTKDCYGLWDGGNVRFEAAERARTWWTDIQKVASDPKLSAALPAYAFARTIIAHPYPDGNGRLARTLVHASFARTMGFPAPVLPLAPAFYLNAAKVALGLRELSETGDWFAFNEVFREVIGSAAKLVKHLDEMT
jgi:hypothetical protein